MQILLKRMIEAVPGGMVIVPLAIGCLFNTFAPGAPHFFGSLIGALFQGALTILAGFYICMGSSITNKMLPMVTGKGRVLLVAKAAP